jgi:hypothetical protein
MSLQEFWQALSRTIQAAPSPKTGLRNLCMQRYAPAVHEFAIMKAIPPARLRREEGF